MARKKATKKGKSSRGNASLAFALIALVIIGAIFYYLISTKNNKVEESIRTIKKPSVKQQVEKTTADTVKAEVSAESEQENKDSVKVAVKEKEVKITTPKPSITEKGKYYFVDSNLPKVCIIIDDFGYIEGTLLQKYLELDKSIAFSILPGLKNSISTMKKARQAGHEVLIHLPMEPDAYPKVNPGDNAIYVKMTDEEIKAQVEENIYQLNLAIGANHHMGSRAAADRRVVNAVLDKFKEHHMFYIDSFTEANSVVESVARSKGMSFARRNIFLDVPEASKHRAILKVDEMAKMKGSLIVVITHCHSDIKYRQLVYFIERLKDKHYQIIPASKAVRLKRQIA